MCVEFSDFKVLTGPLNGFVFLIAANDGGTISFRLSAAVSEPFHPPPSIYSV